MKFCVPAYPNGCSEEPEAKVQFCSTEEVFLLNKLTFQRKAQIVGFRDYWRIPFLI